LLYTHAIYSRSSNTRSYVLCLITFYNPQNYYSCWSRFEGFRI